jgi:hypothetical protein
LRTCSLVAETTEAVTTCTKALDRLLRDLQVEKE